MAAATEKDVWHRVGFGSFSVAEGWWWFVKRSADEPIVRVNSKSVMRLHSRLSTAGSPAVIGVERDLSSVDGGGGG